MSINLNSSSRHHQGAPRGPLFLALGLAFLAITPMAQAQSTADCQMSLSETQLDFGQQGRVGAAQTLGTRAVTVSLLCNTSDDLTLFYRAASSDGQHYDFTDKGRYSVTVRDAQVDGRSVELGRIVARGQPPLDVASEQPWLPGQGLVPMDSGMALEGRSLTARLEVAASVQQGLFSVRDATTWQSVGVVDVPTRAVSSDIELSTRFTPGSCTPSLANGGVVDLGRMAPGQLNRDTGTRLSARDIGLTVQCDAPTLFALTLRDNRDGTSTVNSDYFYGLGLDGASNRIGNYRVQVDPSRTTVDAMANVYRTDSTSGGVAWSNSRSEPVPLSSAGYVGFTDVAGSNAGPAPVQSLSSALSVEVMIAPMRDLDTSNVIDIDGMATLEVIYL